MVSVDMTTSRHSNATPERVRQGLRTVRERRRLIIEMCRRRQRPGTGSALELLAARSPKMSWPALEEVLRGIPWAVVGAVATRHYMPERMTVDLDIVVRVEDAAEVRSRLAAAGYRHLGEVSRGRSCWAAPTGEEVDVLEGGERWWSEALAQAADNRDPQGLPILPLPYLVLTKLRAGRVQDVADVTRMLGLADGAALAEVRSFIDREAPEDLDDLESLIELGQLETKPPSQNASGSV